MSSALGLGGMELDIFFFSASRHPRCSELLSSAPFPLSTLSPFPFPFPFFPSLLSLLFSSCFMDRSHHFPTLLNPVSPLLYFRA